MSIERDILSSLVFTDAWYCDAGAHRGDQKVTLEGYLTQEQFSRLTRLLSSSGLSGTSVDVLMDGD